YNAAKAPPWALTSAAEWTVPSRFGSVTYDVDMDDGGIIGGTADYVTNGAWTNPSAGIVLPPGLIANPDGSPPPGAEPMLSPRRMRYRTEEQLAELSAKLPSTFREAGKQAPCTTAITPASAGVSRRGRVPAGGRSGSAGFFVGAVRALESEATGL